VQDVEGLRRGMFTHIPACQGGSEHGAHAHSERLELTVYIRDRVLDLVNRNGIVVSVCVFVECHY
jgi:hypothetical protein